MNKAVEGRESRDEGGFRSIRREPDHSKIERKVEPAYAGCYYFADMP